MLVFVSAAEVGNYFNKKIDFRRKYIKCNNARYCNQAKFFHSLLSFEILVYFASITCLLVRLLEKYIQNTHLSVYVNALYIFASVDLYYNTYLKSFFSTPGTLIYTKT